MWQRLLMCLFVTMYFGKNAFAGAYPPNGEVYVKYFGVVPDGILISGAGKQFIGAPRLATTTIPHTARTFTVEIIDDRGMLFTRAPVRKIDAEYKTATGSTVTRSAYVVNGKAKFEWQTMAVPVDPGYAEMKLYAYLNSYLVTDAGQTVPSAGSRLRFHLTRSDFMAVGQGSNITTLRSTMYTRLYAVREGKPVFSAPSYLYRNLVNGTNELFCETISSQTSAKHLAVTIAEQVFFIENPNGLGMYSFSFERSSDMATIGETTVDGQYVYVRFPAQLLATSTETRYCLIAGVSQVMRTNSITTYPASIVWSDGAESNIPQWDVLFYNASNWQRLYAR